MDRTLLMCCAALLLACGDDGSEACSRPVGTWELVYKARANQDFCDLRTFSSVIVFGGSGAPQSDCNPRPSLSEDGCELTYDRTRCETEEGFVVSSGLLRLEKDDLLRGTMQMEIHLDDFDPCTSIVDVTAKPL